MTKKIVKIYMLKPRIDVHECVLELFMDEANDVIIGGAITPIGEKLFEKLKNSTIKVDDENVSFADKEKYLRYLQFYYTDTYLLASPYKVQESELPEAPILSK
jgi:hypothetical protein